MKGAIAIFAKTAELTPVKTRLAKSIGRQQAEAFYRLSVAVTETTLKQVQEQTGGNVQPFWALAEKQAVELPQWKEFPAIWTGEGGLGERLNSVSEQLFAAHDFVMMIGTDSPQLAPDRFRQAVSVLENGSHDCVIGPSIDGGFYLLVSRMPVPTDIWKAVHYSRSDTPEQLTLLLGKQNWKIHLLAQEIDVDEIGDLESLKQFYATPGLISSPAHQALVSWLEHFE